MVTAAAAAAPVAARPSQQTVDTTTQASSKSDAAMQRLWETLDVDRSGYLDMSEIKELLKAVRQSAPSLVKKSLQASSYSSRCRRLLLLCHFVSVSVGGSSTTLAAPLRSRAHNHYCTSPSPP